MAQVHQSADPLKDALINLTADNIGRMSSLRVAKGFANMGDLFVGFEGKDKNNQYFQLRVDYDPTKQGHVNLMINGSERHEYVGKTYEWYTQVLNNINGHYCEVPKDQNGKWLTAGQEKSPLYIEGMKKYMRRFL